MEKDREVQKDKNNKKEEYIGIILFAGFVLIAISYLVANILK